MVSIAGAETAASAESQHHDQGDDEGRSKPGNRFAHGEPETSAKNGGAAAFLQLRMYGETRRQRPVGVCGGKQGIRVLIRDVS